MSWQPALTGTVILGALGLLLSGKGAPDVVLMGAVLVLLVAGVITPAEALEGFSNTGMITVAALFVVAARPAQLSQRHDTDAAVTRHTQQALQAATTNSSSSE